MSRPCVKVFIYNLFWSHLFAFSCFANAESPDAIIGGPSDNQAYAAFLLPNGKIQKLKHLPLSGTIFRVAMNSFRESLIGGVNGVNAYAAFVSPDGVVTPLPGLIAPGEIYSVSINNSNKGLIGGGHFTSNVPYAAFVNDKGVVVPFNDLPASGLIYSVAIEQLSGRGIIGGIGPSNTPYAALTSPDGSLIPLQGLPSQGGIFWVAANREGKKLIGGQGGDSVYAAFVTPAGKLKPIAGLPKGLLYCVGLNQAGNGIIGGAASARPYAALVSAKGSVTRLKGLPKTEGIIYNTVLNSSGTGLIAGFSKAGPYGAFVSPDGTLTPLVGLPSGKGFLDGIALHNSGVGVVGGMSVDAPFLAFAAPNGHLTYLKGLPEKGEINCISLALLDKLVPQNIGPFDSLANMQFALSNTLTQHCMVHRQLPRECICDSSAVWVAPFGNCIREKAGQGLPSFSNDIAGALVGFDYCGVENMTLGGGVGYAFNAVHYRRHLGHAKLNQESAVLYASWNKPYFYLDVALWAGGFQGSHTRRSVASIVSTARPKGWQLSPHIELGSSFSLSPCRRYFLEPFIALDWANHWQSNFREKGPSGFNITLQKQHISLLRSEIGLRFFETFHSDWGVLLIEEKASYVNRSLLNKRKREASFVGADSSFEVDTLGTTAQNNGLIEIHLEYLPAPCANFYSSIDYQGEFGASFQSQSFTLSLGKEF